jgi:hypothetical protein
VQQNSSKPMDMPADAGQNTSGNAENLQYAAPIMYLIGRSNKLLQGSGRHKNDDTYNPGFEVDQH